MKKYSTTYAGIIVIVAGTLLVDNMGFTQSCANEITSFIPTLLVSGFALLKRWQQGDIKASGFRK